MGVLAVMALTPCVSEAQDALRSAVREDRAYESRSAGFTPADHQLRAGPVRFTAGLSFAAEYNDNARLVSDNPEDDFILTPQFNFMGFLPISKSSTLSFGAGLGYSVYLNGTSQDRLNLTPNSELAWDIPWRDFVFTFYDNFQYSQEVLSVGALSGVSDYPRFDNTIGTRASWNPNNLVFQLGYSHNDYFSTSDAYSYQDRASEQVFARAGYRIQKATQAGLEVSSGFNNYSEKDRDDSTSVSVGPYVDWQLTQAIRLGVRGGYVFYMFDRASTSLGADDLSSYYFGLEASHQLTEHISHRLSCVRDVQLGINQGSDYIESLNVNYGVSWSMTRRASVSLGFFYEHSTEPQFNVEEEFDRFGISTSLSYRIIGRLSAAIGYGYTTKDSTLNSRDYDQNRVTLSTRYSF